MSRSLALALVVLAGCSAHPGTPGGAAENAGPPGQPLAGTPAQPADPPVVPPPTLAGSLAVTDGAGGAGPFQIGGVSRLQLDARLTAASPGPHTVRLDVVSPSGTVYASVPQDVQVTDAGSASVSQALPVRGTTIETFRRAGTWHITLTLDGGDPLASADVDLTE